MAMTMLTLDPWMEGSIGPKLELLGERICEYKYCNRKFTPKKTGGSHKFCCLLCGQRARHNLIPYDLIENTCETCGNKFKLKTVLSKRSTRFCSSYCRMQKWFEIHPGYKNEYRRKYYHKRFAIPGSASEYYRKYVLKYNRSDVARQKATKNRRNRRINFMNLLGGAKCVYCSCEDYHKLQIDHIRNDGQEDRLRFSTKAGKFMGEAMMSYYTRHPDEAKEKLQVLCGKCNCAKNRKY